MSKLPLSYFIENELLEMIGGYIWIYFPHFKEQSRFVISTLRFKLYANRYLMGQILTCFYTVLPSQRHLIG